MRCDLLEHLTGFLRVHDVGNAGEVIGRVFRLYQAQFNQCRVDWRSKPSITLIIRARPAVGGFAIPYETYDQPISEMEWNPSGAQALARFCWDTTKQFGEPRLFIVRYSAERCLPRMTSLPLRLLANDESASGYTVYQHSYVSEDGAPQSYIGITKHSWTGRWKQHLSAASAGSKYLFHEAIRRDDGHSYEIHTVIEAGLTFEQAMQLEETLVERFTLYPLGLNMIPGGHAGLRYLAKRGFNVKPSALELRHAVLQSFVRFCHNRGRPNPLAAALWLDDAHAAAVICNNPRNFNLQTVREIRGMSDVGCGAREIAQRYGAAEYRIVRLLEGRTYARVA